MRGRVMDPSGAVVPGASVSVEALPKGPTIKTKTDGAGHYRVTGIAPGRYRVTCEASESQATMSEVTITGTSHTELLDIHLAIATQSQQVLVQSSAP